MKPPAGILARYTSKCSECLNYIVTGRDTIVRLHPYSHNWVHRRCYLRFWNDLKQDEFRQDEQHELVQQQMRLEEEQ